MPFLALAHIVHARTDNQTHQIFTYNNNTTSIILLRVIKAKWILFIRCFISCMRFSCSFVGLLARRSCYIILIVNIRKIPRHFVCSSWLTFRHRALDLCTRACVCVRVLCGNVSVCVIFNFNHFRVRFICIFHADRLYFRWCMRWSDNFIPTWLSHLVVLSMGERIDALSLCWCSHL